MLILGYWATWALTSLQAHFGLLEALLVRDLIDVLSGEATGIIYFVALGTILMFAIPYLPLRLANALRQDLPFSTCR